MYVTKWNGERELFDQSKLITSLKSAGATDAIAVRVLEQVTTHISDGISTADLYQYAFEQLHQLSKPLAITYSLKRALLELGPDGFPFEKFVAEIFKANGYETVTDQIVQGACVEHEVDVVAWKNGTGAESNDELVMVEAKFHNEQGYKSDLKVALYVKARFDDLKEKAIFYGGKERRLTKGILITNTKFTEHAIHYGSCQGLSMIGWNYPAHGNLQDMIEASRLHPITCLSSLSTVDKKNLLHAGFILCRDISRVYKETNGQGLRDYVDEARIPAIMEEIAEICI